MIQFTELKKFFKLVIKFSNVFFKKNSYFRNLSAIQDREICCYSISCKEKDNIDITLQWLIAHSKGGVR